MHLIFQTDSSIGLGHTMRCKALAEAWPGDVTWQLDSSEKLPAGTWCVFDGYSFQPNDFAQAKQAGYRVLVIDDNAHLSRYDCDILVDQNAHAKSLKYKTNKGCKQLLGPEYALMRNEIALLRERVKTLSGCRRILLTLGGAPPETLMSTVVQRFHAWECELRICQGNADIVSAMAWADVAVSGAGVTALELCCAGVPAVLIRVFANQEANGKALDVARCAYYLPIVDAGIAARNAKLFVGQLLDSPLVWRQMRERQMTLVDGQGAGRVVEAMVAHVHSGD